MSGSLPSPLHVVLVHGTYARGVQWTRATESALCARIRQAFGTDVSFEAFEWSATNSHSARLKAGEALAAHLQHLIAHRGGRGLFVIGHSHGGTVIANALRHDARVARALDGSIFLSTPFIQLRTRPLSGAIYESFRFGTAVAIAAAIVFSSQQLSDWSWPGWAVLLGTTAVFLGLVMALGAMVGWVEGPGIKVGESKSTEPAPEPEGKSRLALEIRRLRNEFAVRNLDRRRCLFIRANADEASAVLATAQALSRLLGVTAEFIARVVQVFVPGQRDNFTPSHPAVRWLQVAANDIITIIAFLFLALPFLFAAAAFVIWAVIAIVGLLNIDLVDWLRATWPRASDWFLALIGNRAEQVWNVVLYYARWIFGIFAVAVAGLAAVIVVFNRAFGHWFALTALSVEVSVESAPPGRWTVVQLGPAEQENADQGPGVFSLAHSTSYEDPRALRVMVAWIKQRGADSNQASSQTSANASD